eukprot:COSAG05_NODE_9399_length_627_cov_0.257576_1_plen_41_part_00
MQCQYYGCTAFRLLYEYEYRSHSYAIPDTTGGTVPHTVDQ